MDEISSNRKNIKKYTDRAVVIWKTNKRWVNRKVGWLKVIINCISLNPTKEMSLDMFQLKKNLNICSLDVQFLLHPCSWKTFSITFRRRIFITARTTTNQKRSMRIKRKRKIDSRKCSKRKEMNIKNGPKSLKNKEM